MKHKKRSSKEPPPWNAQPLSFNAESSKAEMLCLRRDLIHSSIQPGFLLEPGLHYLKTAPFTADTLFGGRIQAASRADQINASLARSNVGSRPKAFKQPASKSPAKEPTAKKAKKSSFFHSALHLKGTLHIRGLQAGVDPSRI